MAQRRVGGDAGITVGAAALQRQRQVAGRQGPAGDVVDLGQQRLDPADAFAGGGGGAAHVLDADGDDAGSRFQAGGLHQRVDLVHLAAEAEQDHRGEVRVAGVAGDGPAQRVHHLAAAGHAAAVAVGQRDDAVDVGIGGQRGAAEMVGDHPRRGGGAVHRGQHADVVAGGDAAVRAQDALEGGALGLRNHIDRMDVGTERVIALEIAAHAHVVDVDMVARLDRRGGEADDLIVFAHRLARCDGAHRDLVPGRHRPGGRDARDLGGAGQGDAGLQVGAGDDDVVGGVQADGRRCHGAMSSGRDDPSPPGRRGREAVTACRRSWRGGRRDRPPAPPPRPLPAGVRRPAGRGSCSRRGATRRGGPGSSRRRGCRR